MSESPDSSLQALLDAPDGAPITVARLSLFDWGGTLILEGMAGDQSFRITYTDCRDLRWRVYVHERADTTPLVSFAPGRDQQRSPAHILTTQFGLSLYYGSVAYSSRIERGDEC